MNKYTNIDEYIENFPNMTKSILINIMNTLAKVAPQAVESINYGIPTYKINGKNLVHFAGFKNHIGFYPGPVAIEAFKNELTNYKTSKGTIQFPLDKPIPYDLIAKITEYRVENLN